MPRNGAVWCRFYPFIYCIIMVRYAKIMWGNAVQVFAKMVRYLNGMAPWLKRV